MPTALTKAGIWTIFSTAFGAKHGASSIPLRASGHLQKPFEKYLFASSEPLSDPRPFTQLPTGSKPLVDAYYHLRKASGKKTRVSLKAVSDTHLPTTVGDPGSARLDRLVLMTADAITRCGLQGGGGQLRPPSRKAASISPNSSHEHSARTSFLTPPSVDRTLGSLFLGPLFRGRSPGCFLLQLRQRNPSGFDRQPGVRWPD